MRKIETKHLLGLENISKSDIEKIIDENARQIITAGGKNEKVLEKDDWEHSAFTKNILTGLGKGSADIDGDGICPNRTQYH